MTTAAAHIKAEDLLYGERPVVCPNAVVASRRQEGVLEELLLGVKLVLKNALHPPEAQVSVLFQGDVIKGLPSKQGVILQSLEHLGLRGKSGN